MQINQIQLKSYVMHFDLMQNLAYYIQLCKILFQKIKQSKSNYRHTLTIIFVFTIKDTSRVALFD